MKSGPSGNPPKIDAVDAELIDIQENHGGLLRPADVVEYARDPASALHDKFEWDDRKAGHAYRLEQARHLIRVRVVILEHHGDTFKVRAHLSLQTDRQQRNGGYRSVEMVLSDPRMRAEALEMAQADMTHFIERYQLLEELAGVFTAMRRVLRKTQPKHIVKARVKQLRSGR